MLKRYCMQYILSNFEKIVETKAFDDLKSEGDARAILLALFSISLVVQLLLEITKASMGNRNVDAK